MRRIDADMTSLGITFSDSCNWAEQIENITAAAWTRLNLLFYKTDSDKTVQFFSFVLQGYLLASGNH